MVKIRRVYEDPERSDGRRVFVERLWPRGISKERASVTEWMKDIAPSPTLRAWYAHDPEKWAEFRLRYRRELGAAEKADLVQHLVNLASEGPVTLVYAAKDEKHNSAAVLKEYIEQTLRK